jgi:hypothetical protein
MHGVCEADKIKYILNYFQLVSYAMPYLEQLGEMLEREERGTVYNYLMWRVVMELMPYLPLRSSATSKHKTFKEEKKKS